MAVHRVLVGSLVLFTFWITAALAASGVVNFQTAGRVSAPRQEGRGISPVVFTANCGQWPDSVLFRTHSGGATIWITRSGLVYQFFRYKPHAGSPDGSSMPAGVADRHHGRGSETLRSFRSEVEQLVIKGTIAVAEATPVAVGIDEVAYKCNFFLGNDPRKWRTNVPNYSGALVRDMLPGVDLMYSADPGGVVYCQVVPGSENHGGRVIMHYEGDCAVTNNAQGHPTVITQWGDQIEAICVSAAWSGRISPVESAETRFAGRSASLAQTAASMPLFAIQSGYSTYLGGNSNTQGNDIAVDALGCVYVTGSTIASNFPTVGAFQVTDPGGLSAFVTKLSAAGNALLYSTYLGGSLDDEARSIAVDTSGAAYVTGITFSTDFPTVQAIQDTLGSAQNGLNDAFVAKLSAGGDSLLYGTYLGGSYEDDAYGIAVGAAGEACLTGRTFSIDFPTANAIQPIASMYGDAFVARLTQHGDGFVYSTYFGQNGWEWGFGIAVDGAENALVTGSTASAIMATAGAYQMNLEGGSFWGDAFVAKFSRAGDSLLYSTYLGGSGDDVGLAIDVSSSGVAYVTGWTVSTDFPVAHAVQNTVHDTDAFVTAISVGGDNLLFSTYHGGALSEMGRGIALSPPGAVFVTGSTNSVDFPTVQAFQGTYQGGGPFAIMPGDAFVSRLSSTGDQIDYSTYLGGSWYDVGSGIDVDAQGAAYVIGSTISVDFPIVNAYDSTTDSSIAPDAFITKLLPWCPITMSGDINTTGSITSSDIIAIVNYVFKGGEAPQPCVAAGDINCSGSVTSSDVISLVNFVFKGGPPPCDACTSLLAVAC